MLVLVERKMYVPLWLWAVPCAFLGLSILGADSALALVRLVVTGAALWLLWVTWTGAIRSVHVAMIVLATVFNPILPLWMSRGQWILVDLVAIGIFVLVGRDLDRQFRDNADKGGSDPLSDPNQP